MVVPPFHHYLDPVLATAADGQEHRVAELVVAAGRSRHLDDDDLRELIPSGRRSRHQDRTYWAVTYVFQAGLLERPVEE